MFLYSVLYTTFYHSSMLDCAIPDFKKLYLIVFQDINCVTVLLSLLGGGGGGGGG